MYKNKKKTRNELARLGMGTIFLVIFKILYVNMSLFFVYSYFIHLMELTWITMACKFEVQSLVVYRFNTDSNNKFMSIKQIIFFKTKKTC